MSAVPNELWQRRCSVLLLDSTDEALEMSDLHVTFEVKQEDVGTPDNARIRIENLSRDMESMVQEQYQRVVIQAGYWGAPYGVIFSGSIRQFRKGRTDAKTTYMDILASDGDLAYNYAFLRQPIAANSTPKQRVDVIVKAMTDKGVKHGEINIPNTGGILPRGKVLFGLARAALRQITADRGASWNMLHGRLNITPLDGYLPGEAVVLSSKTGLIGRAEQTEGGVMARCLINPQLRVGGLVRIDNASINVTEQAPEFAIPAGQLAYDRYTGVQMLADIAADGLYRIYVAEFSGDTRGRDWYCDLTLLAVDPISKKVKL
jgi:hypothetical protein